jgi:hypothetical protein
MGKIMILTSSFRFNVTVVLGVLTLLPVSGSAGAQVTELFDFDTGNAALEVVIPAARPPIRATLAPGDAPLILRITTLTTNAWFDAIAPYHPTAVGVSSRLGRRPAVERATNRQRNIAILYASYHMLRNLLPGYESEWRQMLTSTGLDPDEVSQDVTTPVGIGNRAAAGVIASREHDGMNQLGDEGGRGYHRQPYADYLGYQPVNTADVLRDPARWQPNVVTTGSGIFRVQEFVTPQFARTRPYSYRSPTEFSVPRPVNSDPVRNPAGYRAQAEQVLAASRDLNDYRKLTAEHFDNKMRSLSSSVTYLAETDHYTLDQFIVLDFLVNLAAFDAGIATWFHKLRHDAVRPFSAIRHLHGDRPVTAWGGPGRGTVTDITGREWRGYLNTADHPEYPSGSAAFCSAHAQASRRFTGTDHLGQIVPVARGAATIEPGVTPAADTVLGPWHTWTQWETECGQSRLWGGVHFPDAITAGHTLGNRVGDKAYQFVAAHIRGEDSPMTVEQP